MYKIEADDYKTVPMSWRKREPIGAPYYKFPNNMQRKHDTKTFTLAAHNAAIRYETRISTTVNSIRSSDCHAKFYATFKSLYVVIVA